MQLLEAREARSRIVHKATTDMNEESIFAAALAIRDPTERSAYVKRACGGDPAICRRIEDLLRAHGEPGTFLEPIIAGLPTTSPERLAELPGDAIEHPDGDSTVTITGQSTAHLAADFDSMLGRVIAERYKIREAIGEGGMGAVFLADQTQPVRRQVALKLIRAGMDSRMILARFEAERQALALMDHPNIAKVLDAGATDEGRPFFVMELVDGIPLTDYCDEHRLNLPERLALFRQICSAVQHAHQKGVIHRDLKPGNILVESHDGRPVPKVIDFGLAKAAGGLQLSELTLHSAVGSIAGTPLYMAPEQAMFNAIDIDTRADIYALGVILYELLTGTTPIARETFKGAALDEVLRLVREVDPPTPSSRIGSSAMLSSVADRRGTEPSRLGRFVRGDLDWIVMKALAKERHRRYDSAIGLANDIERFLNNQPVSAYPPSASYRFRKFVRRNRGQVVAAALVVLALVAGIVGVTIGLFEARRQGRLALIAAANERTARGEEARQRRQAEKRLSQIEKANNVLGSIFEGINPRNLQMRDRSIPVMLGERLDRAAAEIQGDAIGDALTVAKIQFTLARSQHALGYADKALGLADKALATFLARLGAENVETLDATDLLAECYTSALKFDRAIQLHEQVVAVAKARFGPTHWKTLSYVGNLAVAYHGGGKLDRAILLLEETLPLMETRFPNEQLAILAMSNNLGTDYLETGKFEKAVSLFEKVLPRASAVLGRDSPFSLSVMANLATAYTDRGDYGRAIALAEEAVPAAKDKLGPDHPDTLLIVNTLANAWTNAGKFERTIPMLEQAVPVMETKLGAGHPTTLSGLAFLASAYQAAGRDDRALALYERAYRLSKAERGPDHQHTLSLSDRLASVYATTGQADRAFALLKETYPIAKARLRRGDPVTLSMMETLAEGHWNAGNFSETLSLLEELLAIRKTDPGADPAIMLRVMNNLATCYGRLGKLDKALPLLEEALPRMKALRGADHMDTLRLMTNLASGHGEARNSDRALSLLDEVLPRVRALRGTGHPETLILMVNLASGYGIIRHYDRAMPVWREVVQISRLRGAESPEHAGRLSMAAVAALGMNSWTEAESLAGEALAIRKAKEPDAWTTFNTRALVGAALLGQRKYAEAEPLLTAGYEGMKQRLDKIPPAGWPRVIDALDRLIELAEATNKPEDAKRWREEKAKLPATNGQAK
jgi:eukaryotic-like serine/threonine-protein kinase